MAESRTYTESPSLQHVPTSTGVLSYRYILPDTVRYTWAVASYRTDPVGRHRGDCTAWVSLAHFLHFFSSDLSFVRGRCASARRGRQSCLRRSRTPSAECPAEGERSELRQGTLVSFQSSSFRVHCIASYSMGQTQTVFLPPWIPSTEDEKRNAEEFRAAILRLSAAAANLIAPHPLHNDPEFCFDWVEHRPFAEAAYSGDRRLHRLLPKLVPKRISEEEFWRNYFSHVFAVKRRYELGAGSAASSHSTTHSSTDCELPAEIVPATPASPSPLTKTVNYPDKFHLALKYAAEGPPLPNLSDADRILLEALQQQATQGECSRPRPGMWETAEDKAKFEAWKKLGTMSKAEAMHLYVCATIELVTTLICTHSSLRMLLLLSACTLIAMRASTSIFCLRTLILSPCSC